MTKTKDYRIKNTMNKKKKKNKKKFKILILGSNSQIGRALIKKKFKSANFIFATKKMINFFDQDFEKKIIKVKPDLLINLVAFTDVEASETKKKIAKIINFYSVEKIVKICKIFSIKLIHISTDYVFTNNHNKLIAETKIKKPLNYYGYTKSIAEDFIIKSNINYVIIRTSWVFSSKNNNFVTKIINLALKNNNVLRVVTDEYGKPTSSILLADAIILIIKKMIDKNEKIQKIYHIANKGIVSRYNFSKKIIKNFFTNKKIKIEPILSKKFTTKAKRSKFSILETKKFEKDFKTKVNHWEKDLKMILKEINL